MNGTPYITIVLLTKNGGSLLRDVLESVFSQRGKFEVIAVDSGSTDGTLKVLADYHLRLIEIPPEEFNHGSTRNLGALAASPVSKYIVFLSQDAVPAQGWLEALIRPMEEDIAVAGVFSRQVPREDCSPILKRYMFDEWEQVGGSRKIVKKLTDRGDYARRKGWYTAFSNTSSAVRRDIFMRHPFRPTEFAEDRLWAEDALEAGYKIIYEPASIVVHSHDYTLIEQFRQNFDAAAAMCVTGNTQTKRGGNALVRLPRKMASDAAYIWREAMPLYARLGWIIYMPLWHMAVLLGSLAGLKKDILPRSLVRVLSRQTRIKHGNTAHS